MNYLHVCSVQCTNFDPDKLDLMGLESDPGKWLPFSILFDCIVAAKLTTDDEEHIAYNCTTIFTENGDTFIIDTPYVKFLKLFEDYYSASDNKSAGSNPSMSDQIEL